MLRDPSFDAPTRLWVLAALAVLTAVVLVLRRFRARRAEAFAEPALLASVAPHRLGWRRPAAAAGLALAVVSLTTAFARPSVLAEDARQRAVVVIALDTSASMLAQDVAPNRFDAAKHAAQDFLRDLPEQVDVGLVGYGATASLVVAPTSEHEQVADAVDRLALSGGTAMGDALQLSLDAVLATTRADAQADATAMHVVLLSDGDSTVGRPLDEVLEVVRQSGVPVTTIGFGTQEGVVVGSDRTYSVPVNHAALEHVAEVTGGTAYQAPSAGSLRDVYDDITTQLVAETRREDVADVLAGLGLVLLIGTAVPSLAWSSRLV